MGFSNSKTQQCVRIRKNPLNTQKVSHILTVLNCLINFLFLNAGFSDDYQFVGNASNSGVVGSYASSCGPSPPKMMSMGFAQFAQKIRQLKTIDTFDPIKMSPIMWIDAFEKSLSYVGGSIDLHALSLLTSFLDTSSKIWYVNNQLN
jgi:hypothetical protein